MQRLLKSISPPPKLSISAWADRFRRLSSEASAEPGQWRTSRAEYQRAIMDTISEPGVQRVVLMCSAQVGKTEVVNNVAGFHISHDPAPILVLQPTDTMAETWSKDRLAPMLRDTPVLRQLVSDSKARDSGNTISHKRFPGGHLTVVGANSPASLASRPIRIVLADEVDRYPKSAGAEGDPLSLAIKRTTTFWNRRIVEVSTPTIKGHSRIEMDFLESDQRHYHVACPHCDHKQRMVWAGVKWPEGEPEKAAYHCSECGTEWTESDRMHAIKRGEWVVTNAGGRFPGFHLSELYSPWSSIKRMVADFLAARKKPETLKTWVNTCLGETWEAESEKIDEHQFSDRLEDWPDGAPVGVLVVTAGVDVQADRLEIEKVGWGVDEESWSLDYHVLRGDPSDPELWRRLDAYLQEPTIREDGRILHTRTTCIDSGGHHTQTVYRFCKLRRGRRVFAIKGRDEATTVWPPARAIKKGKPSPVTIVGVTAAKDAIYAYLRVDEPGPGYCHFPVGRSLDYFKQLTSEVVETKHLRGFAKRMYVLPDGLRNESLDCRVYAYAALQSLSVRWGTEMRASAQEAGQAEPPKRERASLPETVAAAEVARAKVPEGAPVAVKAPTRGQGWLQGGRGSRGRRWL